MISGCSVWIQFRNSCDRWTDQQSRYEIILASANKWCSWILSSRYSKIISAIHALVVVGELQSVSQLKENRWPAAKASREVFLVVRLTEVALFHTLWTDKTWLLQEPDKTKVKACFSFLEHHSSCSERNLCVVAIQKIGVWLFGR